MITFVLLLIAASLFLGLHELGQAQRMVYDGQDVQLMKVVHSVDNDIFGHFLWYSSDLAYMTELQIFADAEAAWLTEGSPEALLAMLERPPMKKTGIFDTLVAEVDGETRLSTSGRTDYVFSAPLGSMDNGVSISLCTDGDGRQYIALCKEHGAVRYAALVDAEVFYSTAEQQSAAGENDDILLVDSGQQLFFYREGSALRIAPVNELAEDGPLPVELRALLAAAGAGQARNEFFPNHGSENGKPRSARLAILPALESGNGCFTVGVLGHDEDLPLAAQRASFRSAAYFSVVVLGVVLLLIFLLNARHRTQISEREVALLRERTAAIEDLNRKTMELAHHQRLETVGTLTSSVSHEFNNLLTPIMGYSMMTLEALPTDSAVYDNVLEIYNASRRAKELVSRIGLLTRKGQTPENATVLPDVLVRETLSIVRLAQPKNVEVKTELACGSARIRGSHEQFSQILLNLILNAFQAMEDTGGTLTVSASLSGENVVFRVADTGPGIPEDVQAHIFEPFYTTKKSGKGTGLGLAIVGQLVREHHGQIQVDPHEGAGTRFQVSFPAVQQADQAVP